MKGMKLLLVALFFGVLLGGAQSAKAQCAQCAATVETNNRSGAKTTNGLNQGILYLLAAPYLVVGAGGYIWYKNYRKKNVSLKMGAERFNMN